MSYFLSLENLSPDQMITITGEEAKHILLSRRMKVGEMVKLQGPDQKRYECIVAHAAKNKLEVKVVKEVVVPKELSVAVALFQAVVSEKALDFIFQKSTELGVAEIVLFNATHTATVLTQEQFEKKRERWNKILWEASKQSDRGVVPKLHLVSNLDGVVGMLPGFGKIYVLDGAGIRMGDEKFEAKNIAIIVGPEGGLTQLEIERLSTLSNSQLVAISNFTLRAETAAIAAVSWFCCFD